MDDKIKKELERASTQFYAGNLPETYRLLRRFYDRLPFKQEPEHAHYIGIFARTLLELKKEWELKFYMSELERLYQSTKCPCLGYQLASVYSVGPGKNIKRARELLNETVKQSNDPVIIAKAKMFLAYCYDYLEDDVASCRKLIDSIKETGDRVNDFLLQVWKAKILRDEKKFDAAETELKRLLKSLSPESNWYCYFTTQNILAILYIRKREFDKANLLVAELRKTFKDKKFNTIDIALIALEKELKNLDRVGLLEFVTNRGSLSVQYGDRRFPLSVRSASEKLLINLAKKKFLDRAMIMKVLFNREYIPKVDDKKVYYHMHLLRKLLNRFGVPAEALSLDGDGYRLMSEVKFVEAQS